MAKTFFFYDLETTGVNPRTARVMQFAGQRTDMSLRPIGEPINVLIKLTDDIVPDPDAILITGITPQQSIANGINEVTFLKQFIDEVAIPDTIFVGFNTVRFDDEFMRFMLYRNFYDPYAWQWQDGRSRWDLLDVVRMTRALRPDGIKWPFDTNGKPSNRLELLTAVNSLDHADAHDALSDVQATIALAQLLRKKQPKLFAYLLMMRDKKQVAQLIETGQPFVYSSGKYASEYEKTTIAQLVTFHPKRRGAALVYDLRVDPRTYADKTAAELAELWRWKRDATEARLPVKTLRCNVCPAIAPLGVLDQASQKRLQLDMHTIREHRAALESMVTSGWADKLGEAVDIFETTQQTQLIDRVSSVDTQLYDGFIHDHDTNLSSALRAAEPNQLLQLASEFQDIRLQALVPLYKARNFPTTLSPEEQAAWETHRSQVLLDGGEQSALAKYFKRLAQLAESPTLSGEHRYILEELQLYGQSIMPVRDEFDESVQP